MRDTSQPAPSRDIEPPRSGRAPGPRERLRHVDLGDLLARLLCVAEGLHRRMLRSYRGAPEPRDLVQQAIVDVLDERRRWPPQVDAYGMLCGVMWSRATNFVARQRPVGRTRSRRRAGEGSRHADLNEHRSGRAADAHSPFTTPDAALMSEELRTRIRELVAGDDELERMVDLLLEDPRYSAADLADRLGTSVRTIYNARKRLRRRLDPLRP